MVIRPLRSMAGSAVPGPPPAGPDHSLALCRPASPLEHRRPKALVGDDARALLLLISNTLQTAGFEVATARTGRQVIERTREFKPDIVLLDIGMPEMDGISVCRVIRRESDNPDLPIVMVTGLSDEAAIHRAFDAGATGFITKPFDWSNFEHRIHGFLSGHRTAQSRRQPR